MNSPIRRGRFMLAWLVAGIAVLPLSLALCFAVTLAFSGLIQRLNVSAQWFFADDLLFIVALFWSINGFCIGCLQKAVVKRYLHVDLGSWRVMSTLGALLAGVIAYPCIEGRCLLFQFHDLGLVYPNVMRIAPAVVVAIYLTIFAVAQCLALKQIASGRWRWVAAHLGALILAALVSMDALVQRDPTFDDSMLYLALDALFVTLATGFVMLRMLSSPRGASEGKHDEWACQPAPIQSPAAERSLWDEAI